MSDSIDTRLGWLQGEALHTSPDPVLNRIAQRASELGGSEIGLVSLVLDHVQFFRAFRGLEGDLAAAQATDRDLAFCARVVADRASLVVTRAMGDERVPQGLVESHGVRAYVGVPVLVGTQVAGTVCTLHSAELDEEHAQEIERALRPLADQAAARLQALALVLKREVAPTQRSDDRLVWASDELELLGMQLRKARRSAVAVGALARLRGYLGETGGGASETLFGGGARRALDDLETALRAMESHLSESSRHVADRLRDGPGQSVSSLLGSVLAMAAASAAPIGGLVVSWTGGRSRLVQADHEAICAGIACVLTRLISDRTLAGSTGGLSAELLAGEGRLSGTLTHRDGVEAAVVQEELERAMPLHELVIEQQGKSVRFTLQVGIL